MEVQDFIEEKCIPECNIELVIDYLKSPAYYNNLKRNQKRGAAQNPGFNEGGGMNR